MKRKLGMNADCIPGLDSVSTLEKLKAAGFEATFVNMTTAQEIAALKKRADELGVDFEFIHAPFGRINDMWLPGDGYRFVYDGVIASIDAAAANGIEGIILHVSSGFRAPHVCDLGIYRYDELVAYAKRKNVVVAFENLRKSGNIACLMDRYEDESHVRFCYDVGHEHCYTVSVDMMGLFGDKLSYTHVHDNFGRDKKNTDVETDLHLLPFDGDIDYRRVVNSFDEYGYRGSIMLEVFLDRYEKGKFTADEFITEAYKRARRINEIKN